MYTPPQWTGVLIGVEFTACPKAQNNWTAGNASALFYLFCGQLAARLGDTTSDILKAVILRQISRAVVNLPGASFNTPRRGPIRKLWRKICWTAKQSTESNAKTRHLPDGFTRHSSHFFQFQSAGWQCTSPSHCCDGYAKDSEHRMFRVYTAANKNSRCTLPNFPVFQSSSGIYSLHGPSRDDIK